MIKNENDPIFQSNETNAFWITSMLTAETVLVELLRARGGPGHWFDVLRADLVKQAQNLSHEGLSVDQELRVVPRTVRLINGICDAALKAFRSAPDV